MVREVPPGEEGPLDPESSLDLLRRAQSGDQQALERLCKRYLPALRRWATGRLPRWARDVMDTDDLVQETLVRTLSHLEGFEPRHDGALQAYLVQAIRNRIHNELRRASRRPAASAIDSGEPDRSPSPLEQVIGRDAIERYETALERLEAGDREAIVLRIEMGYDYEELARALGKPSPDAARMTVSRALVRLAREMGSHG